METTRDGIIQAAKKKLNETQARVEELKTLFEGEQNKVRAHGDVKTTLDVSFSTIKEPRHKEGRQDMRGDKLNKNVANHVECERCTTDVLDVLNNESSDVEVWNDGCSFPSSPHTCTEDVYACEA
ncbi:Hypothetical predicted protein [Paramuricea clavata]|uniref:Uncharacterized protein n=1 Tax=Paramuricea clavata TaxID=317549 RepID=A0A6S7GQZ2_PARCT|nr:Hypothetical predicted protein [Paramuricea clavata]